jgi:hypothetical protein
MNKSHVASLVVQLEVDSAAQTTKDCAVFKLESFFFFCILFMSYLVFLLPYSEFHCEDRHEQCIWGTFRLFLNILECVVFL